ncbi:MAG: leucyl aminopeptidase [Oligoflexia bacterium]|nr:leucyl aminopeptidase [Oligoflexia bacterium]
MRKLTALEARTSAAGAVDTDVIAVFQDSGKKPVPPRGAYSAHVERLRHGEAFAAKAGSLQFIRFGGKGSVESCLFVGFGLAGELTEEKVRSAGGHVWSKLLAEKSKSATVHLDTLFGAKGLKSDLSHARLARVFAEGLVLGAYRFNKHKTSSEAKEEASFGPAKITFLTQEKALKQQLDRELANVMAIAECVQLTRDWSNEPSNHGTPEHFAAEARKLARQHGLKVKVLTEADAAREKMGLYLGVGQGSEREGRIVVLEYNPKGVKRPKTVAFVGKGITFDSGGISIKPSARMEEMKHDMTGAATVMGATILAAKWGAPNRIVAILAFTENMPDGKAIQPGNVLKSRSGKTVEVINTDAEGRLILADVLDYAQDFKPDAVIDIATLTGAVSVALGKQAAGVLGNDDQLIDAVRRAGEVNGERMWQLPLWDEYFEDLKSDTADMRNSANDALGGTIRGAMFLKQFIRKGTQWAHLDIAAMASGVSQFSYLPKKGASGIYVRTLAQFAKDF